MNNQSIFEYEVYLSIRGDFNPDEATEVIGLSPTYVLKKGEQGIYTRSAVDSIWNYSLGRKESCLPELQKQIELLVNQFSLVKSNFKIFTESSKIQSVLQVYLSVPEILRSEEISFPSLTLSRDSIAFLSDVGAEFDLDIS